MHSILSIVKHAFLLFVTAVLVACGGDEGSSTPSSGNSVVGAPSSIIGKTVVQTVTRNDGSANVIGVGKQITYSFVNANTILGAGLVTLPTTSWRYSLNGNDATVDLTYSVGYANDVWTFTSPNGGTYRSNTGLITGTKGWHEGTFTVSNYSGSGSGSGSETGAGTGTSSTGQIAVWSSDPKGGNISVSIDGSFAGTLTQYFTSTPTCGANGTVTKTLSAGSHTLSATATGGSWGPTTFNITAGGCLTFQLNN
jgi:hypothetical protein